MKNTQVLCRDEVGTRKTQIEVTFLENGKKKTILLKSSADQVELWKRQRNGEISVISTTKVA